MSESKKSTKKSTTKVSKSESSKQSQLPNSQIKKDTQLTQASEFDVSRIRYSAPISGEVPNSNPLITYKRININYQNKDGTLGELIVGTSKLFSFGVSENKDPKDQSLNGYSLSLVLHSRDGATEEEKAFVACVNDISKNTVDYLVNNRDDINEPDLEHALLKKFNPLYYKKDKITKKVIEGSTPTLYAKLIIAGKKKDGKGVIRTFFNDPRGNPVDPLSLIGKYCYAMAAVKFESIFIGANGKCTLQVKLHQAEVELMEQSMKPLLPRQKGLTLVSTADEDELPLAMSSMSVSSSSSSSSSSGSYANKDDETGSLSGGEDEPIEAPPVEKPAPKKVKKVAPKV
jgi:hypothetical protein